MKSALVISSDTPISSELVHALRNDASPCQAHSTASLSEARALLAQSPTDLVFLDVAFLENGPDPTGLGVAPSQVVFMIGHL